MSRSTTAILIGACADPYYNKQTYGTGELKAISSPGF